ncbi:hypothetical protein FA95DRAFT_494855 [Auriscalpium vulgare]|uniref:Uncharacterized protein n=1 Tax=Auriscalpium vulgare TaxID=40419 RepID=A0ACB8S3Y9_9AGAM|nr:hypothetical protein FA95DRAFT_494855 [Auriscalpium vulgare]
MAKKKNKQVLRPWCWYCEREFEDEKVLMQHQKAKHFKCNMCPRRLNTAGGLAVHIQQVHKLEPENLPRIDNALPGRDGYEVEIFGMEGIPAPDVADYKRRKEIELGLNPGSISQPQAKRPKTEHRPLSEDELKAQLAAHRALMGASEAPAAPAAADASQGGVYGAPPQAYAAPPTPASMPGPPGMGLPPGAPPFLPPGMPPGAFPGQMPFPPHFPPGPGMPGMPGMPGYVSDDHFGVHICLQCPLECHPRASRVLLLSHHPQACFSQMVPRRSLLLQARTQLLPRVTLSLLPRSLTLCQRRLSLPVRPLFLRPPLSLQSRLPPCLRQMDLLREDRTVRALRR